MVTPSLRAVLERGFGAGDLSESELPAANVRSGSAEHPVCGDVVQLQLHQEGSTVRAVRWRANGCPASMAVAALAAEVLVDVPVGQLQAVLQRAIAAHGGLARHEHHAEAMTLRALREATSAPGA